jgi:hypothetical protein
VLIHQHALCSYARDICDIVDMRCRIGDVYLRITSIFYQFIRPNANWKDDERLIIADSFVLRRILINGQICRYNRKNVYIVILFVCLCPGDLRVIACMKLVSKDIDTDACLAIFITHRKSIEQTCSYEMVWISADREVVRLAGTYNMRRDL